MKTVGLVGPIASGKGVVAKILEKRGFKIFSLSDIVREEAKKRNFPQTRGALQDVGDLLRRKGGKGILAERTLAKALKSKEEKVVIDSIRNPAEVKYLKKNLPIKIIAVVASPRKRFTYMKKRNYPYDPKTWKEFVKVEKRDRGVGQSEYGQQVSQCIELADYVIENNKTLKDLEKETERVLKKIGIS